MKKLLLLIPAALIVSCSGEKKEEAETTPKGKMIWVCDSIVESYVDSTGSEITNKKQVCDSVFEAAETKE